MLIKWTLGQCFSMHYPKQYQQFKRRLGDYLQSIKVLTVFIRNLIAIYKLLLTIFHPDNGNPETVASHLFSYLWISNYFICIIMISQLLCSTLAIIIHANTDGLSHLPFNNTAKQQFRGGKCSIQLCAIKEQQLQVVYKSNLVIHRELLYKIKYYHKFAATCLMDGQHHLLTLLSTTDGFFGDTCSSQLPDKVLHLHSYYYQWPYWNE